MSKKTKRLKLTGPNIRTKTDAEQAMAELRELHLQLAQTNLDRENEIKALDERFQNTAVMLQAKMDSLVQSMEQWASDNREEFGKAKSLALTHGKIGWHINPPAVKQLSGWKVEDTIRTMQESDLLSKKYIRQTPSLNKEAIINDRETILPETLRACGIRIAQDEPFYAEPKIEEVNPQ
jgi:phage host-nuclease inhibitor protein Gam